MDSAKKERSQMSWKKLSASAVLLALLLTGCGGAEVGNTDETAPEQNTAETTEVNPAVGETELASDTEIPSGEHRVHVTAAGDDLIHY